MALLLAPDCAPLFLSDGYKEYLTAIVTHFAAGSRCRAARPQGQPPNRAGCPCPRSSTPKWSKLIALGAFIRGRLGTRLPQEIELAGEERFHVRRHLLEASWEVAARAQGGEPHRDPMAVDIPAALRNEGLFERGQQKVFDQFVV